MRSAIRKDSELRNVVSRSRFLLRIPPQASECSTCAAERIRRRKRKRAHAITFCLRRRATADVPGLLRRIGAYDEEIWRGTEAAMTSASGEENHIAGGESQFVTAGAAKNDTRVSSRDTENFVSG